MNGLDALAAQAGFEVEIEIGRIDTDEQLGALAQQPGLELAADTGDLGVVPKHLDVAAYGQLFLRPPALEAVGQHARTADADSL
ncbi:hypothetical protein D9M68_619870 [compost metagenome]